MLARLLKRKAPAAPAGLPASVEALIDGATFTPRPDSEGKARVLVLWPAGASWHHTAAETERRVRSMWPELNDDQVKAACRAIASRATAAQRQADATNRPAGPRWRDWSNPYRVTE